MAQPHGVPINLDDLDADFDSATIARGVQYADQGRVHDAMWCADEWVLTGSVLGSGNRLYRTEVGLDEYGPSGRHAHVQSARTASTPSHYC